MVGVAHVLLAVDDDQLAPLHHVHERERADLGRLQRDPVVEPVGGQAGPRRLVRALLGRQARQLGDELRGRVVRTGHACLLFAMAPCVGPGRTAAPRGGQSAARSAPTPVSDQLASRSRARADGEAGSVEYT